MDGRFDYLSLVARLKQIKAALDHETDHFWKKAAVAAKIAEKTVVRPSFTKANVLKILGPQCRETIRTSGQPLSIQTRPSQHRIGGFRLRIHLGHHLFREANDKPRWRNLPIQNINIDKLPRGTTPNRSADPLLPSEYQFSGGSLLSMQEAG